MLTYLSKQSIASRKDGSTGKPRNLVIWTALSDLSSVEHGKHTIKTKQSKSQENVTKFTARVTASQILHSLRGHEPDILRSRSVNL